MTRPRQTALARYREALDYIANYILVFHQVGGRDTEQWVQLSVAEHLREVARTALRGKGNGEAG